MPSKDYITEKSALGENLADKMFYYFYVSFNELFRTFEGKYVCR